MNRTTVMLSLALIASIAAFILWGTSDGILPFKVFGNPKTDVFMAIPFVDSVQTMKTPVASTCR